MRDCVIDASVAFKWLVKEEFSTQALQLLYGELRLIAPDLIFAEVANALWKMRRRRELRFEQMGKAINTLRFSPLYSPVSMQELSMSAIRISAEIDHAVYDCYYLALAIRLKCALITADKRFSNKARDIVGLAVHIVHISEVASELGHDPDTGNVVHEPMPAPFVGDANLDRTHFTLDEESFSAFAAVLNAPAPEHVALRSLLAEPSLPSPSAMASNRSQFNQ